MFRRSKERKEESEEKEIAFMGIPQSGKTHALALLGITAVELAKNNQIEFTVDETELELYELMEQLRSGQIIATHPSLNPLNCRLNISFPKWGGLSKKKAVIAPIDTPGELLEAIMDYIPGRDNVQKIIQRIKDKRGIELDEKTVESIMNTILNADGYILVVDSGILFIDKEEDSLSNQKSDQESIQERDSLLHQNMCLIRFLAHVRRVREKENKKLPRGVAILLTKTDLLSKKGKKGIEHTKLKASDVEEYIYKRLPTIIPELNYFKRKGGNVGFFYSYLEFESDDKENVRIRLKGDERTPVFSHEQYERLLYWIRETF